MTLCKITIAKQPTKTRNNEQKKWKENPFCKNKEKQSKIKQNGINPKIIKYTLCSFFYRRPERKYKFNKADIKNEMTKQQNEIFQKGD